MIDYKKNCVIPDNEKKKLEISIKLGIYNELYNKSLLTYGQLSLLMEKEKVKKLAKRGAKG